MAIKSKHWGLRASTILDEVLSLGWVDNNTVQLMTTRHHPRELDDSYYSHPLKRHGIPEDSVQPIIPISYYPSMYAHIILLPNQTPSWPLGLSIPHQSENIIFTWVGQIEMLSRERFILINAEAIDIGGHCLFFC